MKEKFLPRRRRRASPFGPGEALKPKPGVRRRCGECPRRDAKKSWCPLLAAPRPETASACRYGVSLMEPKEAADAETPS
jgi:hypothetical protein